MTLDDRTATLVLLVAMFFARPCGAQTPNWVRLEPPTTPGYALVSMAYDSTRQRVVLFGTQASKHHTWEWDGNSWSQMSPNLSPPQGEHAIAYDVARQRVVLFSGIERSTWLWDGIQTTSMPRRRYTPALMYDAGRRRVVLFGGSYLVGMNWFLLRDTWEFDGRNWIEIKTGSAPPAAGTTVYDSARREGLFVFPGYFSPETWVYRSGQAASVKPFGKGCGPSPTVSLNAALGSRPIRGARFDMVTTNWPASASIALMSAGLSNKFIGNTPLPLSLTGIGMKGCSLYHSFDAWWLFRVSNGSGTFPGVIPNTPTIAVLIIYFQAAAGSVASNGLEVLFGDL